MGNKAGPKHVAITGASSGIGAALSREMGRHGYRLTLVARRGEILEKIAADIDSECHIVAQDLADPEKATSWIASAEEVHGPIDVLVNNAGVQLIGRTQKMDLARVSSMLDLNLHTPLRLTQALLPKMLERGSGTIVDVSSVAAIAPTPYMSHYSASKAALSAFSECLRGELLKSGVHVVTVYPGPIDTPMGEKGYAALEDVLQAKVTPMGSPTKLAKLIRRAVERGKARVIYPRFYVLARWFPGLTRFLLDRLSPAPRGEP